MWVGKIFFIVFERRLLCSLRPHLCFKYTLITFTFTFSHLADAFIQSDLQMRTIEAIQTIIITVILWNIITVFYSSIFSNIIYSCDGKAEFSAAVTAVFSITWSFRNHTNTLIWCSRNISCWKQLCSIFTGFLINRKFKRTAFIWNTNIL